MPKLTALPLVTKLSNNVIRILGCNPGIMTLQGTNTYLVGSGQKRILIDAGGKDTAPDYMKLLKNVLIEENARIKYLLLTHWHRDHTGGVQSVKEMLKVNQFQDHDNSLEVLKLPRAKGDCARSTTEELQGLKKEIFDCWAPLEDEQCVEVEGAKLRVKHTPGHTTDHACLLLEDENILFSGDCILGEGTAVFEDLQTYIISLQKILKMEPKLIYPGHGPVINDPIETIKFYISHRIKRENDILRVLEGSPNKPLSEMDIVEVLYKNKPQDVWPIAAYNVGHHLTKLLKEKRVKGRTGEWQIIEKLVMSKM